ncbi:MAG: tetratricopeptide repeat protein [Methanoregula sp.]|nr:tetratricopeptide repeat protein [Methanoregula sp.]
MNFRRYLIIPAVLLLAVLIIQPALSADNLTELISGKNVTSVTNYTPELEKDPGTNFYNYGVQSVTIKDYNAAIAFFDKALAENKTMLEKTDALLYVYQGKTYAQIQLGKFSDAVATADAGLAIYKNDAMLWNNRGWALENLGKNQDALVSYDKAVSLDGNYTNALINQGNLLSGMGKYPDAIAAYTRANETDPFNIAASDGLEAAKKGELAASQTMTIVMVVVLLAAIGIVVWYIKFRKSDEPAPEEKKKRSKKK